MTVGLNKASVFAVVGEEEPGAYAVPTVGSEFLPLRPGNEVSYEPEELKSDELLNDIGASKSFIGKEKVSGKHDIYLKHSGIEGTAPQTGILFESIMGSVYADSAERFSLASSTDKLIKVTSGANFKQGQAVLIKSPAGSEIRNISSIVGNDLNLNFSTSAAIASSIGLGRAVVYMPEAQNHPTFSTTKYLGNGFAKEVSAGNTTTEASFKMEAGKFAEVSFSFEGTKYLFNPVYVEAGHAKMDFEDDTGVKVIEITAKTYKTPIELADAVESAMNAVSSIDYLVTFSNQTGLFKIKSVNGTLLNLPFSTGVSNGETFQLAIGFLSDQSGLLEYDSELEQDYTPPVTPVYDAGDSIIIKGSELFIGNQSDNICICAQSVAITISKTVEDVDCICEESGVLEKIPTAREASMEVTAVLKKHDVALLDSLLKNEGISAMFNAGPKTGGNWVPGKCFSAYLQKCTVSKYTTSGDSFIQVNMTLKGYVTTTEKDVYINFV
jgi:hypothetical protein